MDKKEFVRDLLKNSRTLFPLFRYLVLQTETHAFCLALACAALIGFYPFFFLLLSLTKYVLKWEGAYNVVMAALLEYFPTHQEFVINNLRVSVLQSGRHLQLDSIFWIFLGAAGVFIPLESGLNRLWKVQNDRPYWRNQLVGMTLTFGCTALAIIFVAINAVIRASTDLAVPFGILRSALDLAVLKLSAVCFFSLAIFAFYKTLPNCKVDTMQVLPAAILAGIAAEVVKDIYVLVLPLTDITITQGAFSTSVSFVVLAYFETFVVLGGAFLATQAEAYPWLDFVRRRPKPDAAS